VTPAAASVRLVRRGGLLVAESSAGTAVLTQAQVDATLLSLREEREGDQRP
jgi:hypothetical protein